MASFTDAISQFNPYVQQLSVDAMAKVGMYKQQQYDQGVQKVQSYIDNVAGLSVSEKHKPYLQSKLNELGNNLKYVAAGDFSNQQVVNSVGGMATQLVSDPVIQNAVGSAQLIKKGMDEAAAAKKAGKSHKNNDDYFTSQINDWMSDGNLKSTFRGGYTQYTDYRKKEIELAKEIDKIDKTIEQPYMRDAEGKTLYFDDKGNASLDPTKGKAKLDLDMLKITAKGKPAEKILALFNTTFDDNDERQMRIDSWAKYRGKGIETFQGDIDKTFQLKDKLLQQESANLTVDLNNPKLSSVDKSSMQARLNDINEQIKNGTVGKEKASVLQALKDPNNLENFKYEIFKNKHLYDLADELSSQSYEYAHVANPALQMQNELTRIQMTADQNRISNQQWQMTFSANEAERVYQHAKDAKADALLEPKVTTGYTSTEKEIPTLAKHKAAIDATQGAINQLNAESAGTLVKDSPNATTRRIALDKMYKDYIAHPNAKIDNDVRTYVEARRVLENTKARQNTLYNEISKGSQAITKDLDAAMAGEPGIKFPNGATVFTAKDLRDVASTYTGMLKTTGGGFGQPSATTTIDQNAFMNQFKGTSKERIAQAFYKEYNKIPLTPTEQQAIRVGRDLARKYNTTAKDVDAKRLAYESSSLLKYDITRQEQVGTLNPQNKADIASIDQLLGNKFRDYNTVGAADTREKGQFDPDIITEMRTGKGAADLKYTIVKRYDGSADLHIIGGTQEQIVPMSASEVSTFFPSVAKTHPLAEAKAAIDQSMSHTTNAAGARGNPAGAVGAMFSGYDLPQFKNTAVAGLVRYDIEGRGSNDGSSNDRYQIRMYACDKNGVWHSDILNSAGYRPLDDIQLIINNIGTTTYNEVLKK